MYCQIGLGVVYNINLKVLFHEIPLSQRLEPRLATNIPAESTQAWNRLTGFQVWSSWASSLALSPLRFSQRCPKIWRQGMDLAELPPFLKDSSGWTSVLNRSLQTYVFSVGHQLGVDGLCRTFQVSSEVWRALGFRSKLTHHLWANW